jgi:hypothetical protein
MYLRSEIFEMHHTVTDASIWYLGTRIMRAGGEGNECMSAFAHLCVCGNAHVHACVYFRAKICVCISHAPKKTYVCMRLER